MKIKSNLFYKSFFLSLAVFTLVSALILISLYLNVTSVDPMNEESNVLIGVTHNGRVISLSVVNCNPDNRTISFLSLPDNTLLSDGRVLQELYQNNNHSTIESSVEELIGAKIDRYMFLTVDAIAELTNNVGSFDYLILYPFTFNDHEHLGFSYMYGELAYEMFTYSGYDVTKVSMASIGDSYLKSFLTSHASPANAGKISAALTSDSVSKKLSTNLSNEEIIEYCNLLAKYSSFNHSTVTIEGKTHSASSRIYFTPNNYKPDKSIFK